MNDMTVDDAVRRVIQLFSTGAHNLEAAAELKPLVEVRGGCAVFDEGRGVSVAEQSSSSGVGEFSQ